MIRPTLAVIAGFALWSIMWVGGQFIFFAAPTKVIQDGQRFADTTILMEIIAYSIFCSLAAGLCTRLMTKPPTRAPLILGILLLLVGAGVEASAWSLTPVWYHLTFLALLIPAALAGARIAHAPVPAEA